MKRHHKPPEQLYQTLATRVPPEHSARIREIAYERRELPSDILREAVAEYLERRPEEAGKSKRRGSSSRGRAASSAGKSGGGRSERALRIADLVDSGELVVQIVPRGDIGKPSKRFELSTYGLRTGRSSERIREIEENAETVVPTRVAA